MRRKLALLLALVMVLSVVPMMAFAASGSIDVTSTPVISKDEDQDLGAIEVVIPRGAKTDGERLVVSLPSGVKFPETGTFITAPARYQGEVNPISTSVSDEVYAVASRAAAGRLEIDFSGDIPHGADTNAVIIIHLDDVDASGASSGDIEVTLSASPNSGIPTGKVVVAKLTTGSSVKLVTAGRDTALDGFTFHLDVEEETPGSIEEGDTITLRLPNGYEWHRTNNANPDIEIRYGDRNVDVRGTLRSSERDLVLTFQDDLVGLSSFRIKDLDFFVVDESRVKDGEIEVSVTSSGFSRNANKLTVGTRADYGVEIEMDEVEEALSGKYAQELADLIIKENIGETLIDGRTITFRLTDEARWVDNDYTVDNEEDVEAEIALSNSNRTLTVRITNDGGDADTLTIEDLEIMVEAGYEGDIVAEIGGSQGIRGEITLAKAVKPVELETTTAAPTVVIGRAAQVAASFTITEIDAEAISSDSVYEDEDGDLFEDGNGFLVLELPVDVEWAKTPTIKVTEGDVDLGTPRRNRNVVTIPVDAESIDAATIEVTDVELTIYRTVPEGRVQLSVGGSALVDPITTGVWGEATDVAAVTIATVGTPAEGGARDEVSMTIGVVPEGGDAAPYLANNRTYAPVSAVAQALGVAKSNIIWNEANRTVTVLGDKTVQMTIGSTELLVNGTPVVMDAAPEITNSRTFLPIAWLAKALDVNYAWDAVTQTVTFY